MKEDKTGFGEWFKSLPEDRKIEVGTNIGVILYFEDGSFCTVKQEENGLECECVGRESDAADFALKLQGLRFAIRFAGEEDLIDAAYKQ